MSAPDEGVRVELDELLALRLPASRRGGANARPVAGIAPGDNRSRERGRGIELDELRPYQAGDDVRAIDWRATARQGRTFTRVFSEERERVRFVVVDQRPGMFFGSGTTFKSVLAARVAALLCWDALAHGERVGGLVAAETIETVRAHRERRAVLRLLGAVAEANVALSARAPAGIALGQVLDGCLAHAPSGAHLVLVSDFGDYRAPLAATLAALGQRCTLSLIRIGDPLEEALDIAATVGISDGWERRRSWLGWRVRKRYAAARAAHLSRLAADAAACGATLSALSTDDDPSVALAGAARR